MVGTWNDQFRQRMRDFELEHPADGIAVSIKIRAPYGCFHREHSPNAYAIIDSHLRKMQHEAFVFEEHESGPELLVYLALTASGLNLAKSIIDLIVTILKARAEGAKQGDRPDHLLELIIRRIHTNDSYTEEIMLHIDRKDEIDGALIEQTLISAAEKLLSSEERQALPANTENAKPDKKDRKKRRL